MSALDTYVGGEKKSRQCHLLMARWRLLAAANRCPHSPKELRGGVEKGRESRQMRFGEERRITQSASLLRDCFPKGPDVILHF